MKRAFLPFLIIGFISFSFFSCEKKTVNPDDDDTGENPKISANEWLLMDSTYYYSLVFSLWENSLPQPRSLGGGNYDLRSFTKDFEKAEEVLDALVDYTPKIGPNGAPVDRFSFIDRAGQVGEEIGQGIHRNIGVSLQFLLLQQGSNEVGLFIRLVQKNSPSETAGLTRGLQILGVDGETLNFTANSNGQVSGSIAAANKLFTGEVSALSVRDWSTEQNRNVTIPSNGSWNVDPIVTDEIFTLQGTNKKVGYIAYNSFVNVFTAGQPNSYYTALTKLFAEFASEGINELIVDLRYNGGGSTSSAELLTNLIIPTGNNGKVMYKYTVNSVLENGGWTDPNQPNAPFKPVHINKVGNLNLPKVYFLVTSSSASASELVMNNLKPYMDVQIISTNNRGTYGKPVGSFRWRVVNDMADLYITSFKMVNADNQGDYFTGLAGNKQNSSDAILRQLGDPQETMLNDALYHIQNGSYRTTSTQARIARGNSTIAAPEAIDFHIDQSVQGLYNLDYKTELKLNK